MLPAHLGARVDLGAWPVPELFATLVDWGGLADSEAFRVWNMGIGLVAVVDEARADALVGQGHSVIGSIIDISDVNPDRVVLDGDWR